VYFGGAACVEAQEHTPIYQVTVVQRTIKAINYGHRTEPTRIDFQGTVLMSKAKGEATIHARQGATTIEARIEHMDEPAKFGPQFLTYVLWAITPDGRPINLGEIVPDSHDKVHLTASTPLQAFGLMVTAEPYYAVARPSDLVVVQNEVRPDTAGSVESINAKYELLPRSQYTYDVGQANRVLSDDRRKVSVDEYNAIAAVYQAQNALQMAKSQEADRYAPDVYQKAQDLLNQAQAYRDRKENSRQVITLARESTQTSQDALMIAARHGAPAAEPSSQVTAPVTQPATGASH
jgi:hypothetical protein